MGLGKSAQAITAADMIGAKPILILCPAVARLNWSRELARFSTRTLTCSPILSAASITSARSSDVVICSYDLASRKDVLSELSRREWAVCVLDEAHFLKEHTAGRTLTVLGKNGLVHRSQRVWALTGTPAPNDPSELWTLLYTLFPETITGGGIIRRALAEWCRIFDAGPMSYEDFCDRFTTSKSVQIKTPRGGTIHRTAITGGKRIDELRQRIAPIILRRKKEDVMPQLPPISFHDVVVEPTPVTQDTLELCFGKKYFSYKPEIRWQRFHEHVAQEQHTAETLLKNIGLGADGMAILSGLGEQVKSLRRYVGLQKLPKILEMIRAELDAKAYDKIVLFGVHQDILHGLHVGLKDYGAVLIYGGTPPDKRDRVIKRFQSRADCRVFIGQVIAAGTAINLNVAHHVGVVEADWTPGNNQQAVMRCHRIGQDKPVTVRFFSLANSIDERVQKVLKQKTRTLVQMFDQPPVDPFS